MLQLQDDRLHQPPQLVQLVLRTQQACIDGAIRQYTIPTVTAPSSCTVRPQVLVDDGQQVLDEVEQSGQLRIKRRCVAAHSSAAALLSAPLEYLKSTRLLA